MSQSPVNIDFTKMSKAVRTHVRVKAAESDNTIVYLRNGEIIELNPKNNQVKVLKKVTTKGK